MGEIKRNHFYTVDMDKPLMRQDCGVLLAEGDNNGDCFSFALNRGGVALALDNAVSVTMYFVRQDGFTVFLDGQCTGNRVEVVLPAHCYVAEGRFSLAVKVSLTGETVTIAVIDGFIRSTHTGDIADPTEAIPSLDELFAQIEAMEAATAETKAATEYASDAASAALNTTLHLMGAAAPVIIQNASGDGVVSVSDSAERSLSGMSVYGKTTQVGTPTPEAPVELVNAGNSGSITVSVRGKNLLPINQFTKTVNGVTFTANEDGTVTVNGTAQGNANLFISPRMTLNPGSYIFSGCPSGGSDTTFDMRCGDGGKYRDRGSGASFTINDATEIGGSVAIMIRSGYTANNLVFRPMIRPDGTDAAFESYKDGGSMTALTPNGLPGLPVSSGGNYIDSTGQQWVCDEIDFVRNVYVKRVNSYAFTGGESWASQSTAGGYRARLVGVIADYKKPAANREAVNAMCTHYAVVDAESTYNGTKNGVALEMNGTSVTAYDPSKTTENVNVWKTHLAEQNAAGTPLSLLYQLATPIETPLSPEELTGSTSLTAQYPNTTAFNDAGAGMKMEYIADTKTYIDQRIAALLNA